MRLPSVPASPTTRKALSWASTRSRAARPSEAAWPSGWRRRLTWCPCQDKRTGQGNRGRSSKCTSSNSLRWSRTSGLQTLLSWQEEGPTSHSRTMGYCRVLRSRLFQQRRSNTIETVESLLQLRAVDNRRRLGPRRVSLGATPASRKIHLTATPSTKPHSVLRCPSSPVAPRRTRTRPSRQGRAKAGLQ